MQRKFSLLFGLDGTLVDTDALHLQAFQEVLQGCGSTIDEQYYRAHIAGRTNASIIAGAFPGASLEEQQGLVARKERFYRARLPDVRAVEGVNDFGMPSKKIASDFRTLVLATSTLGEAKVACDHATNNKKEKAP